MECLFCKIMNGEVPSKTLFEDDVVKVIMDINPNSNGHVLVIPKKHITDFEDMDNETLGHINDVSKMMKRNLYEALNPDGLLLHVNYGLAQVVKHYHLHLIPIYKDRQEIVDVEETFTKIMKNKKS